MNETRPKYQEVKKALDVAFEAYRQHVPHGQGWNETAVKARDAAYVAQTGRPIGTLIDTKISK